MFLTTERLKSNQSFWKPFLDYLPASNETFFTIDDSTVIGKNRVETMFDEVQNKDDDIFTWVAYGRDVN